MGKKLLFFMFCLFALAVFTVKAQQGGYTGPGINIITVAEARTLRDDTPVILRGKIVRFLGNERYLFSDNTGSIIIEIEMKVWGALTVDENDLVEITGEIDRDFRGIEVEVDTIKKLIQ